MIFSKTQTIYKKAEQITNKKPGYHMIINKKKVNNKDKKSLRNQHQQQQQKIKINPIFHPEQKS